MQEPAVKFNSPQGLTRSEYSAHDIILAGTGRVYFKGRMEDGKGDKLQKLLDIPQLLEEVRSLKRNGQKIVFTNGCFDLLHPGHITYLQTARRMGDVLIVGLNSDRSVRELKGAIRPILTERERAIVLSGLESVDFITIFDEDTPLNLIRSILPDVLVKGGDWGLSEIVGRKEVEDAGGKVVALPYEAGYSTSHIIDRILKQNSKG
jgi:rfaE bifunctional protein nucleotidyltransferase chain/domain